MPNRKSAYRAFRATTTIKWWIQRRFSTAGRFLFIVLFASAGIGMDTNRSTSFEIFTLLATILLTSFILSLRFRPNLTITRELPPQVTATENFYYTLIIENHGHKPLYDLVLFEELIDPRPTWEQFRAAPRPPGPVRDRIARESGFLSWRQLIAKNQRANIQPITVTLLPAKGIIRVKVPCTPLRRGWLRFDYLLIGKPDVLGIVNAVSWHDLPGELLILPKRYATPNIDLPGTRKYNLGGVAMTSNIGDAEEFISLRDYRPGDPLRTIHWRSWAKAGKPVVKEMAEEFFARHALLIDTFCAEEDDSCALRLEEAVSVAASFVIGLENQETLLDVMFVGDKAYTITTGRGLGGVTKLLEILASVEAQETTDFSVLTAKVTDRISLLSAMILILVAWDEKRMDLVKKLRRHGLPVMVFVMGDAKPDEFDYGPLADEPGSLHFITVDAVAEGLANV
jgi:uncharacterized protein (DUF58 family)